MTSAARAPRADPNGPLRDEVWVWLPRDREGALHPAAFELLHEALGLCRRLDAAPIALSDRTPDAAEVRRLAPWGLAAVRTLGAVLPPHPLITGGVSPLAPLAGAGPPRVFLLAADTQGEVLAPLWAAESGALLVPGATGVTCDRTGIVVARPALGERFEALMRPDAATPLVVTLRPGSIGDPEPPRRGLAEPPPVQSLGASTSPAAGLPPLLPPDPATLHLEDAERIVAFGRGAFSPEAVALVEALAARLGAVVAGTRPAADEGWLPFSRQVGLTGAIVHPQLYVAVGLSGAPYHMVGVKSPGTLVAINRDADAPILAAADLGIVGDLYQVLPRLVAQLEAGEAPAALSTQPAGERQR